MPNLSEQLLDVDLLHGRRDLGFRIEQFDGHFDVVATKIISFICNSNITARSFQSTHSRFSKQRKIKTAISIETV